MSITPRGLAESLRKFTSRRATAEVQDSVARLVEENGSYFFVYDNDGGILKVTVTQYKEPIR